MPIKIHRRFTVTLKGAGPRHLKISCGDVGAEGTINSLNKEKGLAAVALPPSFGWGDTLQIKFLPHLSDDAFAPKKEATRRGIRSAKGERGRGAEGSVAQN